MPKPATATGRDDRILDLIFNPDAGIILEPENDDEADWVDLSGLVAPADGYHLTAEALAAARQGEVEAVAAAEAVTAGAVTADASPTASTAAPAAAYDAALALLDAVVAAAPSYASAYNNRAQVHRLRGDTAAAMADLNRAIHYARHTREPAADPHPPASGAAAPADAAMADSGDRLALLGQIYTQRAVLHKQNGAEGAADLDFAQGARFGNAVAKRAVKENPYGKLCNATMAHAMARLYQPQANEAGPQPAAGPPR